VAKPTRPRNVNQYSAEFKLQAVKLSNIAGVQVKDVAEALDIHPFMLSKWRKDAREGLIKARTPSLREVRKAAGDARRRQRAAQRLSAADARQEHVMAELAALKREHTLLKREHELLKKAIRFRSARRATSSRSSRRSGTGSA
jgi:transposase